MHMEHVIRVGEKGCCKTLYAEFVASGFCPHPENIAGSPKPFRHNGELVTFPFCITTKGCETCHWLRSMKVGNTVEIPVCKMYTAYTTNRAGLMYSDVYGGRELMA